MKQWLKKLTGIEAEEKRIAEEKAALEAKDLEQVKTRDPKEYATRKKQPWVNVLDVKINENNVRNGFFELDWNKYFIEQLLKEGYGVEGDPEEEVVDRWFRDIVYNMLAEEGMDTNRNAGYINVVPISKGKSEVS
tara:strand:- start:761 stop:1165 length:405 start_codon:yes stop_codon:yes gene_type:complete